MSFHGLGDAALTELAAELDAAWLKLLFRTCLRLLGIQHIAADPGRRPYQIWVRCIDVLADAEAGAALRPEPPSGGGQLR